MTSDQPVTYTAWKEVPETLKTKTQLGKMGLRLSKGQQVKAEFCSYIKGRSRPPNYYNLYDVGEAIEKKKATPKQLEALAKGRLSARTCKQCKAIAAHLSQIKRGICEACKHLNFLQEERLEAVAWASAILKTDFIILDTETTALDGEPVEISIINQAGEILFNSHLKPVGEISEGAYNTHGLSKKDLATAPSFAAVYQELKAILTGAKQVIIYNAGFDTRIINNACTAFNLPYIEFNTECAMLWYSQYCGEWHHYYKNFTWQPLPRGEHTALGDCLATLKVIKEMAKDK